MTRSLRCWKKQRKRLYRDEYLKTPMSDYEISFKINTMTPMMICYHFLSQMAERGFGRIVNTSSGINLDPQQAGYSASKAALDKVTRDLGGPNAPNSPESAIPGIVVGAFADDKKSGRWFAAPDFHGMTIEEAVAKAENEIASPY